MNTLFQILSRTTSPFSPEKMQPKSQPPSSSARTRYVRRPVVAPGLSARELVTLFAGIADGRGSKV